MSLQTKIQNHIVHNKELYLLSTATLAATAFDFYMTLNYGIEPTNEGNPFMRKIWEEAGSTGMAFSKVAGCALLTANAYIHKNPKLMWVPTIIYSAAGASWFYQ